MDQHLPKRTLRPTASMPTTAETYGQKHGIDPNLTLALQNIGRRGRQSKSRVLRLASCSPLPARFLQYWIREKSIEERREEKT